MRTKSKRSSRRRYADQLWSRLIHTRDRVCQMGGECEGPLEAAHIIGKQLGGARYATRWNPDNGVLLCRKHHREFDGIFDKHSWAKAHLGEESWEALKTKALDRWDRDYSAVIADLKVRIAAVEEEGTG